MIERLRNPRSLAVVGLMAILTTALVFRLGTILDDRTWYDEDYILLEAHGIALLKPWPSQFVQSDVLKPAKLADAIALLAQQDAYPPFMLLIIYAMRTTSNPILASRAVLLLLGLVLIVGLFVWLRRRMTASEALFVSAYVAASPLLTSLSQHLKWYSPASLFATLAALQLLSIMRRSSLLRWAGYVSFLTLLVHTHYFSVWVFPAHAAVVWAFERRLFPQFAAACGATAILALPWYMVGLPQQFSYLAWFFGDFMIGLASSGWLEPPWYRPVTLHALVESWGYNGLVALGLQPSPLRVRHQVPLVAIAIVCVYYGRRSPATKRLTTMALATLGVALVGQSIYAARLGRMFPLDVSYLAPWVPLGVAAVAVGAIKLPRRWLRIGVGASLLIAGLVNAAAVGVPPAIRSSGAINHYVQTASLLASKTRRSSAILYRNDRDAKMMNLFYRGDTLQMIGLEGGSRIPERIQHILIVYSRDSSPVVLPDFEWTAPVTLAVNGVTRIDEVFRRGSPSPER